MQYQKSIEKGCAALPTDKKKRWMGGKRKKEIGRWTWIERDGLE